MKRLPFKPAMCRHLAQVFVDLDEVRKALGWSDDAHILSVDGLNSPLGFIVMLVEHPDMPQYNERPGCPVETVNAAELIAKRRRK